MSRARGGYIGFNRVPAAAALNSAASGVWSLREAEALKRAGTWPTLAPGGVGSGLQLWLDASDAQTLYDATSGGSLVAADGGVARWEDKSGNARHATQSTSANRPARKTAVQGGKDVLRFDGTNDFFSLPSLTTTSSYDSFFVFRRTSQGIHSIALGQGGAASGNYSAWWFSDNVLYESSTNNSLDFTTHGSASTLTGSFLIVTTRTATTSIATRRNGSALATVSSGTGVTNAAGGSWSAVGRGDGNNVTHNGDICEIIIYNSALSATDREAVEDYLIDKWGIT
jgi:hypothetical protein